MTQKGDPYTKLFNISSEVRLMSCIFTQLNILCSSLVKPHYTKMTIQPLFTVHTCSPTYWISSKHAEWSIYQNVQYLIGGKNFNFTTVIDSLHKCNQTILCWKRQFTVHVSPVSCALEFMEARKTCHRVVQISVLTMESFAIKTVSLRLPRRSSSEARSMTLLDPINQMQWKQC